MPTYHSFLIDPTACNASFDMTARLPTAVLGLHNVLTVENSSEALGLLAQNPKVDLLLTDVVMPQLSGQQLAEKARDVCPNLPVVFMSGYPV